MLLLPELLPTWLRHWINFHDHNDALHTSSASHPFVEEDEGLQEVVDAGAGLLRGQAVQQQLQRLHPLCHQADGAVVHRA